MPFNPESILDSTKKALNIGFDYDVFDAEIIMHVNSVFSTLNQLGVGPAEGFMIEDEFATWNTFLGNDTRFNLVKTYVFLKVKLLFDPPNTSFHTTAIEKQIQELEWRINVLREETLVASVVMVQP